MKYFSEEEVKKILYDIDYNWKSLPQCLYVYDYKHIEPPESKWNTGKPPMTFEAEGDYLVVFKTKNKGEQYGLAKWGAYGWIIMSDDYDHSPIIKWQKIED